MTNMSQGSLGKGTEKLPRTSDPFPATHIPLGSRTILVQRTRRRQCRINNNQITSLNLAKETKFRPRRTPYSAGTSGRKRDSASSRVGSPRRR